MKRRMDAALVVSAALTFGLALGGCLGPGKGTRPDDMSAAEHRRAARAEKARARAHQARYDPKARYGSPSDTGGPWAEDDDNPTTHHRDQAARHRAHAREHLAAAHTLERFEAASCSTTPRPERAQCPLHRAVLRASTIAQGIRLHLRPGVDRGALIAHMRCHYAFGRARGRKGMIWCPLYLRALTISPAAGVATAVDITSTDKSSVAALRRRAGVHTAPRTKRRKR